MRTRRRESDFENIVRAAAGVKHCAAAALAVRVDEIADRRVEACLPKGIDHEAAFPRPVRRTLPVLQRAPAADAEMRTDRRGTLHARVFDVQQLASVGMAGPRFGFDGFARQRAGNVDRPFGAVGDAVAAVAEPGDDEPLNHARPR